MVGFTLLSSLPLELLQDILERLNKHELSQINLASKWCYDVATPLLWREVELRDRSVDRAEGLDQHDDTPLIRKLLVLAQKPFIAAQVQTLTHRCHLPPPAIFNDLPKTPFTGQTLSCDPRTIELVKLATANMSNVHSLYIIFGHLHLTDALVRCLFDNLRKKNTPVRRLWLESCHISSACYLPASDDPLSLPRNLDFSGLQSIRFRRLPLRPNEIHGYGTVGERDFVHGRGYGDSKDLQDGAGGFYRACCINPAFEIDRRSSEAAGFASFILTPSPEDSFRQALSWDDLIYRQIGSTVRLPPEVLREEFDSPTARSAKMYRVDLDSTVMRTYAGHLLDAAEARDIKIIPSSALVGNNMLRSARETLSSICFDWIISMPVNNSLEDSTAGPSWLQTYHDFFSLRFPRLKALQFRNNVVLDTAQPKGIYLLDKAEITMPELGIVPREPVINSWSKFVDRLTTACIEFMEAHNNLQCLAWPMDAFFSGRQRAPDIAARIDAIINNLGRSLVDLRIDTLFRSKGEPLTNNHGHNGDSAKQRRRRFIEEFASRMTKLESIKIEGGVPRDERKELIRALHACPLKKVVMIGVSSPVANTWGAGGRDLGDPFTSAGLEDMESEDKEVTYDLGVKHPADIPQDFRYEPTYGWSAEPPLIHTIASFHRTTVTELKFCGYQGAPIMFTPTPITTPLLAALKYFDKLESLVLSVWLSTMFEGAPRDDEIIGYWLASRDPNCTSLVRTVDDEEPEGWEKELRTKFAPDALAWHAVSFIGGFLSEKAKSRKGGVHLRISVCIGEAGGIFDMDLRVGKGSCNSDVCLSYKGPREELEPDRRRSKLVNRRWF